MRSTPVETMFTTFQPWVDNVVNWVARSACSVDDTLSDMYSCMTEVYRWSLFGGIRALGGDESAGAGL